MKKYFLINCIILLFTLPLLSQENIIKVASIGSGGIISGIQYERSMTQQVSVLGTIGYATILDIVGFDKTSGFGIHAEGRYYFTKNKDLMEGWHAGAYLHYLNTKGDDGYEIDYYLNSLGIGLNGGYQFVFSSNITFDLFAGGGIRFTSSDLVSDDDGFYPLLGLSLGYNF